MHINSSLINMHSVLMGRRREMLIKHVNFEQVFISASLNLPFIYQLFYIHAPLRFAFLPQKTNKEILWKIICWFFLKFIIQIRYWGTGYFWLLGVFECREEEELSKKLKWFSFLFPVHRYCWTGGGQIMTRAGGLVWMIHNWFFFVWDYLNPHLSSPLFLCFYAAHLSLSRCFSHYMCFLPFHGYFSSPPVPSPCTPDTSILLSSLSLLSVWSILTREHPSLD